MKVMTTVKSTEDNPVLECPCPIAKMDPQEVKTQMAGSGLCSNLDGDLLRF